MWLPSLVLGCLTALSITLQANALHESEVGIVDWHKSLIGIPLSGSLSTAPAFHRVSLGEETKSVVIAATGSNVLAALDPVNGSVGVSYRIFVGECALIYCCSLETCFRGERSNNSLQEKQRRLVSHPRSKSFLTQFFAHAVVAALSGPGGSTLRVFEALSGHLLLEKRLHTHETGTLFEPSDLGASIAFVPSSSQLLVLTNGHTLRSIDGMTGETKWSWTSEDQRSVRSLMFFVFWLMCVQFTNNIL